MSIEVINAVRVRRFGSPGRKAIAYVLADYCDEAWSCYPGQGRIAAEAEVSERTVRTILDGMERAGLLRREKRYGGQHGRTSDRIILIRSAIESLPATAAASLEQPATSADLPATSHISTGNSLAGEPLGNRQVEPSLGPLPADASGKSPKAQTYDDLVRVDA